VQKQDEEALKAALYQEIGQIKAELAQQKKSKRPLVILSTISTGIVVPLILWFIEYFLSNRKWPLVIQITGNEIPLELFVITTVCAYILIFWVIHRITHPFVCTCGYSSIFSGRFKRHFVIPHSVAKQGVGLKQS
jgi:hypothetical protein